MNSKKIGIWGLGISGQNLVCFLSSYAKSINVLDKQKTLLDQTALITQHNCHPYQEPIQRDAFFNECDYIIPSPGITVPLDLITKEKIYTELDLYTLFNEKPTIAITGSLGKTSITTLITSILNSQKKKAFAGGNIGNGIIQAITQQHDYHILELSSFQLEHAQTFQPDIALITNIYANHLDRHQTMEQYKKAKFNICKNQNPNQMTIISSELIEQHNLEIPGKGAKIICGTIRKKLPDHYTQITYTPDGSIAKTYKGVTKKLLPIKAIPQISFRQNWLFIAAILDSINALNPIKSSFLLPPHRMEKVPSTNGINYINDSKSTVMQSTIAALSNNKRTQTILFLGGLSKGVDRTLFIKQLRKTYQIICFGKEAKQLEDACKKAGIKTSAHNTLEEAWQHCHTIAKPGMTVLFSPGGSSYDLFIDYQARGERFKKLVFSTKIE